MNHTLKVAFVHQIDPAAGTSSWVGTLRYFTEAFQRHVGEVADLGPAPISMTPYRAARKLMRLATGRNYSFHHDPALGRRLAAYFNRRLNEGRYDLIFAPGGASIIPFLQTPLPVIGYSDATWKLVQGYYRDYSNVIPRTARWGDELERRMLQRADIMLYPSEWAASSAVRDYGADPEKICVNYLGASLRQPPPRDAILPRELNGSIRLLMVGYSWEMKGGEIAYETLLRLLESGHDAWLTVVGCRPPEGIRHPRLEIIPPLDKGNPADAATFEMLWRRSDLFILPSRFEAAGVAFCEANAYALPALTNSTGGIPSIVRDGVNGFTLPAGSRGEAYADLIAALAADPERYRELCQSSRQEFETRLNWDAWGIAAAEAIARRLPELRHRLPD